MADDLDAVASAFEALLDYEFSESFRGDTVAFARALMAAAARVRPPPVRPLPSVGASGARRRAALGRAASIAWHRAKSSRVFW